MKTHLLAKSIGIALLSCSSIAWSATDTGTTDATGHCIDRKLEAMQKMSRGATEIFDGVIKQPDTSLIDRCLGSINKPRIGFGGLGLPSMSDLLKKVCSFAASKITEQTSQFNYSFDPASGLGNGFGSGLLTRKNSYSGDVGSIYNDFGSTTQSSIGTPSYTGDTMNNGFSQSVSGSQPETAASPSYIDNTVNGAMKYLTGK